MEATAAEVTVTSEAVDAQLARIFAHRPFDASPVLQRFLEYVVAEELAGRGGEIKAYSIATLALGRPASFDPQTDPIVRVTGSKLRSGLELYYATVGQSDPLRIAIPTGGYRPVITDDAAGAPAPAAEKLPAPAAPRPRNHRVWLTALATAALFVVGCGAAAVFAYLWAVRTEEPVRPAEVAFDAQLPIVEIYPFIASHNRAERFLADGIRHQLLVDLAQFHSIRVREPAEDGRAASAPPATYRVRGVFRSIEEGSRLGISLTNVPRNIVLWSRNVPFPDNDFLFQSVLFEAISSIAAEIASDTGVIHNDALNRLRERSELLGNPDTSEYACLLLFYTYDRTKAAGDEAEARRCLRERTGGGTKDSSLWSAWALMLMLDWSKTGSEGDDEALAQALAAARRAVALDPANSFAHENLGSVLSVMGRRGEALAEYQQGLELNPSNPSLYFHIGWQNAMAGDWQTGMPLIRRGIDLSPSPPGYMRIPLSIEAFRRGDYRAALREADMVLESGDQRGAALAYAAAVGLQDEELTDRYAQALEATEGFDPTDPIKEIRRAFSGPGVLDIYDEVLGRSTLNW